MHCLFLFCLLLSVLAQSAGGSKILVFSPTVSRSHMISNGRVADALASDGHDVTLLEVEMNVPLDALNASKVASSLRVPSKFMQEKLKTVDMMKILADMAFQEPSVLTSFLAARGFQTLLNEACEDFLVNNRPLLNRLRSQHFDMIFAEQLNFCGAGLSHLLQIPTYILLSSCPMQEHVASLLGLPNPGSYVPSLFDANLSDRMSLGQRLHNLLHQAASYVYILYGLDPLTAIFRRHFGADFPELGSIVKRSPLVFVSVDELVDFPRPIFHNIVYIGGLGIEQQQLQTETGKKTAMVEPFRSQMTKGAQGVVFFSMGSIMRTTDMDEAFLRHLFQAFARLPDYHFVVKVEKGDNVSAQLAARLPNVFITPWAPQSELLHHARLRLFISHGGYNSLMEAARAGVPLLCMGFFADQYRNGRVVERNGWGMPFEKRLLLTGSEQFSQAMLRVLEEPSYGQSARRIQRLVLNKPFSAYERLTRSIRFLELSGGQLPELLSHSRNMSTVELYNLDLLALAAAISAALLALVALLTRFFWRRFGRRASSMAWTLLMRTTSGLFVIVEEAKLVEEESKKAD